MAFDWLKSILGDSYTEEIDEKISAEIGKSFVARSDFNEVNTAKKQLEQDIATRDQQLTDLKNSEGDIAALKQQIEALQTQNEADKANYEMQLTQLKIDNAVESALTAAGAKNMVAAKALLAEFLSEAKLDKDGTVKGLSGEIESLTKAEDSAFLFAKAEDKAPQFKGMAPGDPGGKNPSPSGKDLKDMSYAELCAYFEEHPSAETN